MARIGILTCSNATQDLGCASTVCLADFRRRRGAFSQYPADQPLDLVGIINCPGCPTLTGPDKLLHRIRALTGFRLDALHFTNCIEALCPFREKYAAALTEAFPDIKIVIGTHQQHITPLEFRGRVKRLFCQPRKTMVDMIKDED
jgi:predicted metal-binding protein